MFKYIKQWLNHLKFKFITKVKKDDVYLDNIKHYEILLNDDKHILSIFLYLYLRIQKCINQMNNSDMKYSKDYQYELRRLESILNDIKEILEYIEFNDYKTVKTDEKFKKMTKSVFQKVDRVIHAIL